MEPEFNFLDHKNPPSPPPLDPILIKLKLVHTLTPYFFKVNFNIIRHIRLCIEVVSSLQILRLISSMCATCPAHIIHHDFITLILVGKK
jgi:hypothetical protein